MSLNLIQTQRTDNTKMNLVIFASDDNPGEVGVMDRMMESLVIIGASDETDDHESGHDNRRVKVAVMDRDDGDRVGVMYDPTTPQPKPQVRVMMVHNNDYNCIMKSLIG